MGFIIMGVFRFSFPFAPLVLSGDVADACDAPVFVDFLLRRPVRCRRVRERAMRAMPLKPMRIVRWPTFSGDVLAGLALAGMLLPEAVAYAAIAGVPTVHALVAALAGLFLYPLLGSSRFATVSSTSSAAAI
ncbi:MAG: SulP family inorganic anion transporter, partial [Brachymonas sp.]